MADCRGEFSDIDGNVIEQVIDAINQVMVVKSYELKDIPTNERMFCLGLTISHLNKQILDTGLNPNQE